MNSPSTARLRRDGVPVARLRRDLRWRFLCLLVATAHASAGEPIVIGETTTLDSQVLGEERALMIHLPDGYAEREEERLSW